ncbi:MAG: glycosyltransferase [Bacteroidales bacterium]|nr:glycosyltransferase [Bacteroidales bacterium]MDD4739301.1 glycosyltransferase [Bacteroidales bacterium]
MKTKDTLNRIEGNLNNYELPFNYQNLIYNPLLSLPLNKESFTQNAIQKLPEILVISSFPPRECGIATYSQDLIKALHNKFSDSFSIKICALESGKANYEYPSEVRFVFDTSIALEYEKMAESINEDNNIQIVLIQHEFGFFIKQEQAFHNFLYQVSKPIVMVFHTVLPNPTVKLKFKVKQMAEICQSIIVMTHTSENILINDYEVPKEKINVIAHGTHLVSHMDKSSLKKKYNLQGRKVLTTFGLLSSGKSIETTIEALPEIVKQCPETVFLVIGKTHPEVVKYEGEKYRKSLEELVEKYSLQDNVIFINAYLSLPSLLEYLQLNDIYLFTTNDPNQAVSGTFVYAMSCACPIISTPIPHAKEILTKKTGIIFDFGNSKQLAQSVISLLNNRPLRKQLSSNTLQAISPSAWENSAIAHAQLFGRIAKDEIKIKYNYPPIDLSHIKRMTTDIGIIQFSRINRPDLSTGYTLDDNARALVAMCMYFKLNNNADYIKEIRKYLNFIQLCSQEKGDFLNYVDKEKNFTSQNNEVNLDDSNGRAIWALGYVLSLKEILPQEIITQAETIFQKSLLSMESICSTRSMAFIIKGIYYANNINTYPENLIFLKTFANRLVDMYKFESSKTWQWFESYLTYANSILPEAMLYTWLITKEVIYKDIAITSLDFLLSKIFNENGIEVISNKNWLQKDGKSKHYGEQPIDVAYTIMALRKFYDAFNDERYKKKMNIAFNWFLGKNRLHQIIYNPCTAGCYDGLEKSHVNLNQGAESTISYLMARLTMEKYIHS